MAETTNAKISMNILPPEMLVKILKLLNYKDLCKAQLICKRWNDIIAKLKRKVAGKILWPIPIYNTLSDCNHLNC